MKKIRIPGFMAAAIFSAFTFYSCSEAPKGDKAVITEEQEAADVTAGTNFVLDTGNSKVRFTGHGVGKNHPGNFRITSGNVAVANNQVTGGDFMIDIKSLDLEQTGASID